ncbi:MAG: hypothetical protein ACI9DC_003212 [Gammaproteobacteria bacterium]|jgi:hypothetical protein
MKTKCSCEKGLTLQHENEVFVREGSHPAT